MRDNSWAALGPSFQDFFPMIFGFRGFFWLWLSASSASSQIPSAAPSFGFLRLFVFCLWFLCFALVASLLPP